MSIGLTAAIKILELAISAIESGIKSYDAATGTDVIAELEAHFGKLGMILSAAKTVMPVVEAAVGASSSAPAVSAVVTPAPAAQ